MPSNPRMKEQHGKDQRDQKDQKDKNKKSKPMQKKRGGNNHDDDDIDDNGNIRGLIDYEYDSDTSSDVSMTNSEKKALKKYGKLPKKVKEDIRRGPPKRKAAIKAEKRIKSKFVSKRKTTPSTTTTESSFEEDDDFDVEEDEDEEDGETLGTEDTDTDDEEEDDDEEDDEYDMDEDKNEANDGFKGISILFGPGGDESLVPKRHNMKKESEDVRKFVRLITKPVEEDTIDDQIDQFKTLDTNKQKAMLSALEMRSDYVKKEQPLMFRLLQMKLSPETMALVMNRYNALNSLDPSSGEYYKLRAWMEKLVSIPLGIYKEMPVRIEDGPDACSPFMEKARKCLDEAIYGQDEAKLQIQQFIASKIANPSASGLSLLLIGPPGIGKTAMIKNGIAKALGWPFQFISLGGDSDATTYTGHQYVYEGSHCGKIANSLAQAKSMSMILMFDELDKVSSTPKGEEVQNLLVHLTDPTQNMDFEDKYLSGIPLDLSRSMFVFSGNDINKIDRILLDRMVVVHLNGYQKNEKIEIAEKFLMPAALREVNLAERVAFGRDVLNHILDNYASEESGVRELKRCIGQIAQRINMLRMFNVKELPFHIPGFSLPFVLKKDHVDLFLKKNQPPKDKVPFGMYV